MPPKGNNYAMADSYLDRLLLLVPLHSLHAFCQLNKNRYRSMDLVFFNMYAPPGE